MGRVQIGTDAKARLSGLADRISRLKAEKSRIEGQVESLEKQRASVEERCRALDVEPAKLGTMIQMREATLYKKIQSMEDVVDDIELRRDEVHRVRNSS